MSSHQGVNCHGNEQVCHFLEHDHPFCIQGIQKKMQHCRHKCIDESSSTYHAVQLRTQTWPRISFLDPRINWRASVTCCRRGRDTFHWLQLLLNTQSL